MGGHWRARSVGLPLCRSLRGGLRVCPTLAGSAGAPAVRGDLEAGAGPPLQHCHCAADTSKGRATEGFPGPPLFLMGLRLVLDCPTHERGSPGPEGLSTCPRTHS